MQFAELRRWQDYRHPGSMGKQYFLGLESVLGGSGDPSYPGECLPPSRLPGYWGLSWSLLCYPGCLPAPVMQTRWGDSPVVSL